MQLVAAGTAFSGLGGRGHGSTLLGPRRCPYPEEEEEQKQKSGGRSPSCCIGR